MQQKLQQRIDLQEHVLRCTEVHEGYHPRNTDDKSSEVECVRAKLQDRFFFTEKFVRELTDDEIRDFIGWVRVNGRVSRVDIPEKSCENCGYHTRNQVVDVHDNAHYVCEECVDPNPF